MSVSAMLLVVIRQFSLVAALLELRRTSKTASTTRVASTPFKMSLRCANGGKGC